MDGTVLSTSLKQPSWSQSLFNTVPNWYQKKKTVSVLPSFLIDVIVEKQTLYIDEPAFRRVHQKTGCFIFVWWKVLCCFRMICSSGWVFMKHKASMIILSAVAYIRMISLIHKPLLAYHKVTFVVLFYLRLLQWSTLFYFCICYLLHVNHVNVSICIITFYYMHILIYIYI